MKDRFCYLDLMKVLGIYLVILGHLPLKNANIINFIFSFHMPLFFFVSGFLFKKETNIFFNIKKNIRRLLVVMIPYFIINMFLDLSQKVLYHVDVMFFQDFKMRSIDFFLGDSKIGWMWFLWALFWMKIIYNMYSVKFNSLKYVFSAFALSIFMGFSLYYSDIRINIYQFSATILSFPFFSFGVLMNNCKVMNISNRYRFLLVFLCAVIYCLLFDHCGRINMNSLNCGTDYCSFLVIALAAISFLLFLFKDIKLSDKLLGYVVTISNGTLVVLGFHGIFLQIFKLLYKKMFHITAHPPYMDSFSGVCISFMILFILYYPTKYILNCNNKIIKVLAGKL